MQVVRNQKGFTLMELVIVMVIIGVLAAIAVPKYFDMSAQAAKVADQANIKAIEAAVMLQLAEQVTADPTYNLTKAVADYNKKPASFFANGTVPLQSNGKGYTVSVDKAGALIVTLKK
jgi:prepilin-type N-terminal cleavage/methylation domain-containing protein